LSELNRATVKVLLTDANVALTFMDIAETSTDETQRKQATRHARLAYHILRQKRPQFSFADSTARELDVRLEQLRIRLKRIGL
jgi:hypothetical protein